MRSASRTRPGIRTLLALLATAWVAVGCVGSYSYLASYNDTRGFPKLTRGRGVRPGGLKWVHFYSSSLGHEADYLVYLPTGHNRARRYSVLYLLHGMPGRPQAYLRIANIPIRLDNLISEGKMPPMILVLPDGRVNGSEFSDPEWANTRNGSYESYVLDVVRDVDSRFPTLADRDHRVIGGYSSGALGALNVALHHLGQFASVEAWSGPFVESRTGAFARATRAELVHYSPLDYAAGLRAEIAANPLQAFLYGGRSDIDSQRIAKMAAALADAGASVTYTRYPGGHDWQLWNAHADQMLILAGRDVLQPPPHAPRGRYPGHHRRHARAVAQRRSRRRAQSPIRALRSARGPRARRAVNESMAAISGVGTIVGLVLALISSALINLGFLLQGHGLATSGAMGVRALIRAALHSRAWLAGQALGWAGFGAQMAAVAIAPLSLVQAFAAGGLAISVPLAAVLFAQRIDRSQTTAVLVVAAALASLPLGLVHVSDRLHTTALVGSMTIAVAVGILVAWPRSAAPRAVAAGLFYGVADAAIKAISVTWGASGFGSLISGWTGVVLLGTFAGFLAFQSALATGGAVSAISLMNAFAAIVALICGLAAFGESLGASPALFALHLLAVASVLACVPVLARAHARMSQQHGVDGPRPAHARGSLADGVVRNGASAREQQGLEPRPETGRSTPEHAGQPQVAGQGVRSLRGEQQQHESEQRGERGALAAGDSGDHEPGDHAGGQPRQNHTKERLAIKPG